MKKQNTGWTLKIFVAVTFIIMITVNALSVILPLNGLTPGAVSDSYPNLFAPAGITFSIWSVIYLALVAHTLYQLGFFRGDKRENNEELLGQVAVLFSVSSLINANWIFSWHYRIIPLSMVLMVLLLVSLIKIAMTTATARLSAHAKLFIRLPFDIYFGWISVATIANATTLLVSLGWNGFGVSEATWMVIILVVGAVIGMLTMWRFASVAYGLVFVWAYTGILLKHTAADAFAGQYQAVIITVGLSLVLFALSIGYMLRANAKNIVRPA